MHGHQHLFVRNELPRGIHGIIDDIDHVQRFDRPLHLAGFNFLETENLVYETRQAMDLVDHDFQEIALFLFSGVGVVAQYFGDRLDGRQWGAQLMGSDPQ